MRHSLSVLSLGLMLSLCGSAAAQTVNTAPLAVPDIPYQKFVLDNGLTLIVHEDHKAPIVAVNVWYHVGSKNEPAGRSGFAHLFEHLMFNGSEHYDDDYFQPFERVGATDMNGTTNHDRTNYFENVPTNALDLALWMESDRMGHLVGAIDQGKLDEQRGVVQNEKRQGENQPYGEAWNKITDATWPEGHPYAHTVIGSMDDLNAASLEDVKDWFKTYYGPNNAVLTIAGDIDTDAVLEKVKHYFGDIPPGPPISHFDTWVAKRTGEQREIMQDRVPQARIYKVWNVPEIGSKDYNLLSVVSDVLTNGKTSRLYKRLVYDDQIASDVNSGMDGREIASQFLIVATARPGVELSKVEQALDEELNRFIAEGPTPEELERAKTSESAGFIRGIERIGGFGGKSDILARSDVYSGSPDAYKQDLQDVQQATTSEVQRAAQQWLSDGTYTLEVHPYPELTASAEGADRSGLPDLGAPPTADFPDLQHATLSNGLKIVLAERHAVPIVDFNLLVDAGFAADQGDKMGTASLAMNMLDEGTANRSALEISDEETTLGANLSTGSNLDMSSVWLSALKQNLGPSLDLFADVVLHPAFPAEELDRLRAQQLAAIQREKVTPRLMALRVFPKLLYGEGHAYSLPFTGSGTEASVKSITRDDLVDFHDTWFKPNNATLVVTGDITMDQLKPLLEDHFSDWEKGRVPEKHIAEVPQPEGGTLYIMDRPGSQQSIILAGHLAPPRSNPDEVAIETLNNILGGVFTSRINMNLREDKHWSYGAGTLMPGARGQRPFFAYAPVQTDKTKESIAEIKQELEGIVGARPVTAEELEKAQKNQTLSLAGQIETLSALSGNASEIVRYGLPDDYYDTYAGKVRALDVKDLAAAAQELVHPDHLVWVIVGDREKIEPGIRALGFGEVRLIDADGNVLSQAGTK
ncbi:MAG TPA: pitrilysin family protein [Rhodothermales bacterium]|nr:pitrilysin family protein [Rhodothermales bacterium]